MTGSLVPRREWLQRGAFAAAAFPLGLRRASAASGSGARFELATFSSDVTVPLGHALMGGGIAPAKEIVDPLLACGFVLTGGELPVVFVSGVWCEIRNDAFDRWREVLATAAGTSPQRVLVTCTHAHDAPVADLRAQRLLGEHSPGVNITDAAFHESAVQRVAAALRERLRRAQRITHIGVGRARVEGVASNRRFIPSAGGVSYGRMSRSAQGDAKEAPEGTIDPFLKTITFWSADRAVCAVHAYATHPMSHYGLGRVSCDFVGLARNRLQAETPGCLQVYASGCAGNVTAGKFNDGSAASRVELTRRIHAAMVAAGKNSERHRLDRVTWRAASLRLEPRDDPGFTVADSMRVLAEKSTAPFTPFRKCLAAMNLSWRERADAGHRIAVPGIDLGAAQILLLPAESYVEYQLFAQNVRPDASVLVAGYGECAPGYIPIEKAWAEKDSNLHDWCWVAPGAETTMKQAIVQALGS